MIHLFDIVEAIKYLILGIVQGVTEVLPVSSSGHVQIAQTVFGLQVDDGLLFLILVNTGSLVTFLFIYWKRLMELIRDFFIYIFNPKRREEKRNQFVFALQIIVACIPAGIVGLLLENTLNNALANYGMLLVGVGLLLTGTVMYSIKDVRILKGKTYITWTDTILIGLAQGITPMPGVSRSGLTSATSIKRGMGIDSALNFSFLLYIPLSLAALLLRVVKVAKNMVVNNQTLAESLGVANSSYYIYYLLAFVGAVFATYAAYRFIFNIFRSGKVKVFSYYTFVVGLFSILYFIVSR